MLDSLCAIINTQRVPEIVNAQAWKSFASEREIWYTVLFYIRQELAELKKMVHDLMSEKGQKMSVMNTAVTTTSHSNTLQTIIHAVKSPSEEVSDIPESAEDVEEPMSLDEVEKEMIRKALERHNGKRKNAAQDLNISERTLYRKIKEYGLD